MPSHTCMFVTLGCAKNEVDTDRMRARLLEAGYDECETIEGADVVIINTCSFLASATSESLEAILETAALGEQLGSRPPIVMCGCVPSRYGEELRVELPEVAAFVTVEEEERIVDIVSSILRAPTPVEQAQGPLRTVEGASAYVKISDGCDRFCTFCAIPYIRGRYASRPPEEIIDEIEALAQGGVREIVLIGQDTGVWGSDFEDGRDLAWLLEQAASVMRPFGGWIRVLYLQPEGMTSRLISAIRDIPEVLPYIDIPIQHCNGRILKLMGRSGDAHELASLFARLRSEIPGMVLRTTGLVGFPTESDDEFEELLEFVCDHEFDYTSVFSYSREDGTAAAKLAGQIDEQTKLERHQRLLDAVESLGFAATAAHVGEVVDVIIDGIDENDGVAELIGHAWFQAPDCDGAVHIEAGEASVGDIVRCKLVDSFCYELVGEVVDRI